MSGERGAVHQRHGRPGPANRAILVGSAIALATVGAWVMYLGLPRTGSYYDTGFRLIGFPIFAVFGPISAGLLFSQYARHRWWGTLFYRVTPSGVELTFRKWGLPRPLLLARAGSSVSLVVDTYPLSPVWRRWTCDVEGKSPSIRAIDRADSASLRAFKKACGQAGVSVSWKQT